MIFLFLRFNSLQILFVAARKSLESANLCVSCFCQNRLFCELHTLTLQKSHIKRTSSRPAHENSTMPKTVNKWALFAFEKLRSRMLYCSIGDRYLRHNIMAAMFDWSVFQVPGSQSMTHCWMHIAHRASIRNELICSIICATIRWIVCLVMTVIRFLFTFRFI